ncbi:tyrosine-protein phosphatase [Streptococcus dysgalactiae]|uniref:tyrosine-protein phosphatase n=1 Tax=Streptococcus dysgalactiae TaxID=1334 RepID=UPI002DD42031|nr:tyrosine-protein phosphatase [Streptococcus dysgalactiae]MEC4578555.1 tyrosine-protein phosphatase [Streptococcus dysgalactiae]
MTNNKFINFRKVSCCKNLYRTGEPIDETIDIETIKNNNIDLFIDLREGINIVTQLDNPGSLSEKFSYQNIPIIDEVASNFYEKSLSYGEYSELYYNTLLFNKDGLVKIFTLISNEKYNKILIGCKFGKDRTGLVIYLLLSFLGIDKNKIFLDYEESGHYLFNNVLLKNKYPQKKEISFNPRKEIMEQFDKKVRNEFYCMKELQIFLNIDDIKLNKIREKFL